MPRPAPEGPRGAIHRLVADQRGASMAEYALLLAAIAIVAVVGARQLGGTLAKWGAIIIPWLFR